MTIPITALPGVGDARAQDLIRLGFRSLADVANATPEALSAVPGFRTHRALQLITAARALLAEEGTTPAAKPRRRSANAATPSPAAPPARKTTSRSRPAQVSGQDATASTSPATPSQPRAAASRSAPKKAPQPSAAEVPVSTGAPAPAPAPRSSA